MKYDLQKSIQILERTPAIMKLWLTGLDDEWINSNEGPETWSPYDVIGHLIVGEKTDWMVRAHLALKPEGPHLFDTFDRFLQFEWSKGKTLVELLEEFDIARKENLRDLLSLDLTENDLDKIGIHPKFGEVTLRNLMATWVAHDMDHIMQIARVMAKQYKSECGPWVEYMRILQ